MKIYSIKPLVILLTILLVGCSDIDALQDDPNRTVNANPELLFTHLQIKAFSSNVSLSAALANRQLTNVDGASQYQYYTWQRGNFNAYDNLKQANEMTKEANRTNQDVYRILANFFKSYFIVEISQQFGDVPYTEAAKLTEGINQPVYDTQESIYLQVLEDLKMASSELAVTNETISGDIIYGGDKLKWRKLINSYALRVLMSLSTKEGQSTIDVAERFGAIVNNPSQFPIFESNEDAGFINYVDTDKNRYPLNRNNSLQTAYYMEKTFVDELINLRDPRLFAFAERTPNGVANGLAEDDFNAYGGLLGSAPFSDLAVPATEGNASRIKPRYYEDPINEQGVLMGYAELQFILAEAAERGWISGEVAPFYEAGITASMNYYGIEDEASINTYLNQSGVKLTGTNTIAQIMTQKHIALFLNTGWQIFYEQRRTGFPVYDTSGGGTGNGGRIPKRFMYPESEINNNNTNLEAAISRQYPAGDDVNAAMWLIN